MQPHLEKLSDETPDSWQVIRRHDPDAIAELKEMGVCVLQAMGFLALVIVIAWFWP